jgi:hypothetical protein
MTDIYYNDNDDEDIIYDSDESSLTKYNIILCELYNHLLHGLNRNNLSINYHYLVNWRFKKFDLSCINDIADDENERYSELYNHNDPSIRKHLIYKNYTNIILRENYIKPEIAQCIYLPTNECIAILKTFWIKLIQRKWKNIMKQRKYIIQQRSNMYALIQREITGKWPIHCCYYPTLKGMLSELKYE